MGPLAGVRVVEFAGLGPPPFACMLLADMGADVVRIDRPSDPPNADGQPARMKRGVRVIRLDLKDDVAHDVALRLIANADILIEGYRPGVMERLGFGPDVALDLNPRLVYARVTIWGQTGPLAHLAGHDINGISVAGVLATVGRAGEAPVPPAAYVGDFGGAGMLLALSSVAALYEAKQSGHGQVVDVSMVEAVATLSNFLYSYLSRDAWGPRGTNLIDSGAHFYDVYETSDGRYVSVGAIEEKFYLKLTRLLGLTPGSEHSDRTQWPAMKQKWAQIFRTRTRAEWCELLLEEDVCFSPVLEPMEAVDYEQNRVRGTFFTDGGHPMPAPAPKFSRTPVRTPLPDTQPPGEEVVRVLEEVGYTENDIEVLLSHGVVGR